MLQGMRSVQKTWVGRLFMAVIMGFIVVSFAVWGVGNVFQNYGAGKLASVGKTEISADAFRNSYQTVLQNAQARNGGKPRTNDQARVARCRHRFQAGNTSSTCAATCHRYKYCCAACHDRAGCCCTRIKD